MLKSSLEQNPAPKPGKTPVKAEKRKKNSRRLWRALLICGAVILCLTLALWGAYHLILEHYLNKINIVTEETGMIFETEQLETVETIDYHNGELNDKNLPLICDTQKVTNILLLSVDSRNNEAGRSDSMILLSINNETKKVVLCSFMRDIWAKYPKEPSSPSAGGYDKLNHAHAYGGPKLTMAVLKETFNIDVKYYAKVNFTAFRDIVDAMGGIDVYLSASEVAGINYVLMLDDPAKQELGITEKDLIYPEKEGMYHLTGVQALCHARDRTVGSDWARTKRQRNLLQLIAEKARTLSLSQLDKLLDTVLPLITTNMPKNVIRDMVGDVPSYLKYEIESTRVPADGTYREQNYNIIPDLEANCTALYELIYGEEE